MKKTLIVSLLLFGASGIYAQSGSQPAATDNAVCKSFPHMPANAVPVWPSGTYTPLEDPKCAPCYEYKSKYGYMTMECPYLQFPPEHGTATSDAAATLPVEANTVNANERMEMQSQNSYTGNYPPVCKRSPRMPANAKPVWPAGTYTPLEDPSCAPCYEYRSKYGYMTMECPYLQFPPEHTK